jgi:hypothetical protein
MPRHASQRQSPEIQHLRYMVQTVLSKSKQKQASASMKLHRGHRPRTPPPGRPGCGLRSPGSQPWAWRPPQGPPSHDVWSRRRGREDRWQRARGRGARSRAGCLSRARVEAVGPLAADPRDLDARIFMHGRGRFASDRR